MPRIIFPAFCPLGHGYLIFCFSSPASSLFRRPGLEITGFPDVQDTQKWWRNMDPTFVMSPPCNSHRWAQKWVPTFFFYRGYFHCVAGSAMPRINWPWPNSLVGSIMLSTEKCNERSSNSGLMQNTEILTAGSLCVYKPWMVNRYITCIWKTHINSYMHNSSEVLIGGVIFCGPIILQHFTMS